MVRKTMFFFDGVDAEDIADDDGDGGGDAGDADVMVMVLMG